MTDLFAYADDLGPEKILHMYDPGTGLKAILVVDNVAAGPAIGGVRMASDVSVEECVRLARTMTFKNAAAGLRHGGAKSVIFGDPKMPLADKERLIRAFAYALKDVEDYIVGPDMGTDEMCMAWINDEIGRSTGLPREIGGIPLDEIGAAAYGLVAAIDVARNFVGLDLTEARVAVQGFGAVGMNTAQFLAEKGCKLVAVADSRGTIFNADGLNVTALVRWKREGNAVADFAGGGALGRDDIIDVECEIWVPAARPDVINIDNVSRIKARIIAEGANIPVTHEAERYLAETGVLVLPDFIANAGGVICAAVEYGGGNETAALVEIDSKVRHNMREVLEHALAENIVPRDAAMAIAEKRVRSAMSYRKSS